MMEMTKDVLYISADVNALCISRAGMANKCKRHGKESLLY